MCRSASVDMDGHATGRSPGLVGNHSPISTEYDRSWIFPHRAKSLPLGGGVLPTPPFVGGLVKKWQDGRTEGSPEMPKTRCERDQNGEVDGELLCTQGGSPLAPIPPLPQDGVRQIADAVSQSVQKLADSRPPLQLQGPAPVRALSYSSAITPEVGPGPRSGAVGPPAAFPIGPRSSRRWGGDVAPSCAAYRHSSACCLASDFHSQSCRWPLRGDYTRYYFGGALTVRRAGLFIGLRITATTSNHHVNYCHCEDTDPNTHLRRPLPPLPETGIL